jgi:hypothetical protein
MPYPQIHQGRYGIGLVTGRFYPHSFGLADLDEFEDFVGQHERCVWMADVAHGDQEPNTIAIRHDVDHSIVHAHRFASWEADHGINATYYVLPTAPYYAQEPTFELMREMQEMGHEIGVHNDAMTMAVRRAASGAPEGFDLKGYAIQVLADWAAVFRENGIRVDGCADHGGGSTPSNVDLWRGEGARVPADADLSYEAYHLHRAERGNPMNYISDNRGGMRRPYHPDEPEQGFVKTDRQTHVLIHPCHWRLP